MTFPNWQNWRVVAKLDPDKEIADSRLNTIVKSGVSTIIVGGTQNITPLNTEALIDRILQSGFSGTLVQEISRMDSISPTADGYAIPLVLNTSDPEWLTGAHHRALKKFGRLINWDRVIPFGYVVCNPDSAVGRYTGTGPVSAEDAVAYTLLADKLWRLPVIYIEYSGIYGDPELVSAVAANKGSTRVIYGGGISSAEQAREMLRFADTVVIGNALYEDPYLLEEITKSLVK